MFYYKTASECEIVVFERSKLHDELVSDIELSCVIQDELATQLIASLVQVNGLSHKKARDKIIQILFYFILRFGAETSDGRYKIDLKLTQSELASFIGLTRETVTAELSRLREEGYIEFEKSQYIVDVDKLKDESLVLDVDDEVITPEPEACEE